jgi:transposase, IS5 family
MGEAEVKSLLSESPAVAIERKALSRQDVTEMVVDTSVMPKNVMFPTDGRLMNRAREKLVRLAKEHSLELRQVYMRLGKRADQAPVLRPCQAVRPCRQDEAEAQNLSGSHHP